MNVLQSERGQLMEAFAAAVILGLVLVGVAMIMANHAKTSVRLRRFDQSKQLADMVFEQYNSFRKPSEFTAMNHPSPVIAGVFLGGAGDMGFHDLTLTSQAACPGAGGSGTCDVSVTVFSNATDESHKYQRTFTPNMTNDLGATVDVWVISGVTSSTCNGAQPQTFPACGGVGGFQVTASSSAIPNYHNFLGTTEVLSYTQGDGHAILRNVATGVPLVISAKLPGTAVNDQTAQPTQGYYVAGSTRSADYQSVTINPVIVAPTIVVFRNFLPLGSISGTLTNSSGGQVDNMLVVLQSTASTGYGLQYNPTWNVITHNGGHYTFHNVLPGLNIPVFAAGDPGSEVAVPPSNTSLFRQGYSNHAPYFASITPATDLLSAPAPAAPTLNVSVQKLGTLHVVVDPAWHAAHPTDIVNFWTRLPSTLFRHSILINTPAPADFYNVFDQNIPSLMFSGQSASPGPLRNGYFAFVPTTGLSVGTENTVTLQPSPTKHLRGFIRSHLSGHAPVSGIIVACASTSNTPGTGLACPNTTPVASAPMSGAFSLPGFAPELAGPYINKVLLTVTVGSTLTTTPIYGSLYEYMDASGIGSASISDSFHPPALTGANGSYSGYIVGNPFSTYNVLVSYKCTPITSPPGPGPSADCWVVAPPGMPANSISVDSSLNELSILANTQFGGLYPQYYEFPAPVLYAQTSAPRLVNLPAVLNYYGLTGQVLDAATNRPLDGILVCDRSWQLDLTTAGSASASQPNPPKNGQCTTTAGGGFYSFAVNAMPISVSNRYINSPITPSPGTFNSGYVEAYAPNNQTASNGKSYAGGSSGQVPIPHPAVAQGSLGAPNILLSPAPGSI